MVSCRIRRVAHDSLPRLRRALPIRKSRNRDFGGLHGYPERGFSAPSRIGDYREISPEGSSDPQACREASKSASSLLEKRNLANRLCN